jgi:hypothetical protein
MTAKMKPGTIRIGKPEKAKITAARTAIAALAALAALTPVAALGACAQLSGLDVIGKNSIAQFGKVLGAIPGNVQKDDANGGWSLEAPDGAARFIWSENYSKSPAYDVMLELDAKPFADAGLDAGKLPENYISRGGTITVGAKLGNDELQYAGDPTALASYEQIVGKYRDAIGYHAALDHFNVNLGDGNMFEWAKDFSKNGVTGEAQDKDIVFVLAPGPLIAAGVAPEKVEGWAYAPVTMDMGGQTVQEYKFLKPFDIQ